MRPNWFLAVPFTNLNIKSCMENVQKSVVHLRPKLSEACVSVKKAHLTLFVFHLKNQEEIDKVIEIVQKVTEKVEFDEQIQIEANQIGHFQHRVIFFKLNLPPKLLDLRQEIGQNLLENGIKIEDNFTPHLTVMKLSQMKKKVKKIDENLYQEFSQDFFGVQNVKLIELLSMNLPIQDNGYYFCQKEFPLKINQA